MAKNPIAIPEWKPGMRSRWVVVGSSGRRVPDLAVAVAAAARLMMVEHGEQQATVHTEKCGLGKADASPNYFPKAARAVVGRCTCRPEVITRS